MYRVCSAKKSMNPAVNGTRAVKGIDSDVKLNRALWVMAENMLAFFGQ